MKKYFNKKTFKLFQSVLLYLTIFFILQLLISNDFIQRSNESKIKDIIIKIILAISLNVIVGLCGQLSLGHAGFMAIGAYSSAILINKTNSFWGLILGIIIGIIITIIISTIISIPISTLKGDYLLIVTLAFAEAIRNFIINVKFTQGASGISGIKEVAGFPIFYLFLGITLIVLFSLKKSRFGRAWVSINEDEIASQTVGVNIRKYKVLAFVVGSIFASLAGSLYAVNSSFIEPRNFTFDKSIEILLIVVLGGMGSFSGSIIAAIALGLIQHFIRSFSDYTTIIYAVALLSIMLFRPQGLLGDKEFSFEYLYNKFKKEDLNE